LCNLWVSDSLTHDIEILGNTKNGQNFVKSIEKQDFLFSLVISYTETCEISGITIAGSNPDVLKFTPPADAEYLHFGYCKSINEIPMTPDGKPTPALLTKVALESAKIPHVIINAGSIVTPKMPYFETGLKPGKNISKTNAMDRASVLHAIEYGKIIGKTLASVTNCLVIGESIPGGTTTAMAVMKSLGIDAQVSSSMPENPIQLKNKVVTNALKRLDPSDDVYEIVSKVGDPMIPLVSGMISVASELTHVLLAGGTQMSAVLAFAKKIGFNKNNVAIGTTSYILNDKTANFLPIIKKIADIPVLIINPNLEKTTIKGLKSFSEGFVKEGAGAGGAMIASMLKTNIDSKEMLELIEKEYNRIFILQSQI